MSSLLNVRTFSVGLILAAVAFLYKPIDQRITTVGLRRSVESIPNIHGHETRIIPNTLQCEDVHLHKESGLLFAACQTGDPQSRYEWFPPLSIFKDHKRANGGGLFVIDPETFTSKQLTLTDFPHAFVTHGIDVISNGGDHSTVLIFAVNHLPNPAHYLAISGARNATAPKALSQIEIFEHKVGSSTATHLRTVRSPTQIRTPNDILATSPTSFYVTNDHHYREGLGRGLEDLLTRGAAPWTDIQYVTITDQAVTAAESGFHAFPVMRGLHNSNGLAHAGPDREHEIIATDASGGVMYRLLRRKLEEGLQLVEEIQMPICLDNPSWYEDPWKTPASDASGYVLNGLARGVDLGKNTQDPTMPAPVQVYHIRAEGKVKGEGHANWEQRLVFSDKGTLQKTASAAVIVGIDPKKNGGKKQGWLFVTGFMSDHMTASKIDL